jgi:hypothetical protein
MGLIKFLYKNSLLGKTTTYISDSIQYYKDKKLISDTFYGPAFKKVINQYLKTDLKKDWIGRLYGVVNPTIHNGELDFNNMIVEIDGDNTNNNEYVKHWVYKQMQLISNLFKIEKLYDYIDIDFSHVGPINMDNYLVVFDIVSRKIKAESGKSLLKRIGLLTILAIIGFVSFKFFI